MSQRSKCFQNKKYRNYEESGWVSLKALSPSQWDTHWLSYPRLQPLRTLPGFLRAKYFPLAFVTNILNFIIYLLHWNVNPKSAVFHLFCLYLFPLYLKRMPDTQQIFIQWMDGSFCSSGIISSQHFLQFLFLKFPLVRY